MSPLKSSPLDGTRLSLLRGFMYIYQGARREPGVGVKERIGEGWRRGWLQGRLSNCLHVNFKLNSPCPGTIYTLECKFFFLPLSRSLFFCYNHFFFSFWRHLTADGKMQINVHMESLALWIRGCESVPTDYSGKIRNRCLWLCSHCKSYTTILFLEFLLPEMFLLFYFTVSAPSP